MSSDRTKHEHSKKGPKEYLQGRVHHVSAETIRDDSLVILGMLLVNSIPASVLIDPRATHSFISTQFAAKHEILKLPMKKRMVVKSSGKRTDLQLHMSSSQHEDRRGNLP